MAPNTPACPSCHGAGIIAPKHPALGGARMPKRRSPLSAALPFVMGTVWVPTRQIPA
jgi:hypothetical protein